ncbi:uncharacterized protein [Coffea arabica]|uniref:Embryo defective 1703 n=1 Tax=Coffea arabica TaxID=13443 RepID=A0ABM4WLW7_COFAR
MHFFPPSSNKNVNYLILSSMDLLNRSTTSSNHLLSPPLPTSDSIFSPNFPFKSWKKKTCSSRLSIPNSKKFPLSPIYSPLSWHSRFKLCARLRRPSNRQNYLRKKLTQHKQVSPNSDSQNATTSPDAANPPGNIIRGTELESKSKLLGGNVFWDKLEDWVEQYKKDVEFWGIGTGPIFTIFQDSEAKVERVAVNEDEIFRRSGVDPLLYMEGNVKDFTESVNERVSRAKFVARELENGKDVLPGNSSVVKFVASEAKSDLVNMIQGVSLRPVLQTKLPTVGITVACCVFVILAFKRLFTIKEGKPEYTRSEKEMMRRKLKARLEKEKTRKGMLEVIQDSTEPVTASIERPQLDKQELMNSILKAGESNDTPISPNYVVVSEDNLSVDVDHKVPETRALARQVRESEKGDSLPDNSDAKDHQTFNVLSNGEEINQKHGFANRSQVEHPDGYEGKARDGSGTIEHTSLSEDLEDESGPNTDDASTENAWTQSSQLVSKRFLDGSERPVIEKDVTNLDLHSFDAVQDSEQSKTSNDHLNKASHSSVARKFRVIKSVKEAREYLAKKHDDIGSTFEHEARTEERVHPFLTELDQKERDVDTSQRSDGSERPPHTSTLTKIHDSICTPEISSSRRTEYLPTISRHPKIVEGGQQLKDDLGTMRLSETESSAAKLPKETETDIVMSQEEQDDSKPFPLSDSIESLDFSVTCVDSIFGGNQKTPAKEHSSKDVKEPKGEVNLQLPGNPSGEESKGRNWKLASSMNKENWLEENFHEIEPIVKKIGVGFRDNYMMAKARTNDDVNLKADMGQLMPGEDGNELEWMKNERLREIVFKVRENEMAGRDPFHLMDDEDKIAFYSGLEKKVEQENAKLANLHEWVHSNIENLDYGADGISLYDPPEKIIPRWRGPPVEKIPEFLKNSSAQPKKLVPDNVRKSNITKQNEEDSLQLSKESSSGEASALCNEYTKPQKKTPKTPRTVVEGSDGSVRAGKKSGKEYWQHTRKWSHGFLESYNAETDPEVKAIMRDMGKDLDRWITEKEIKEAADLMDKLPERGQELIKEKLNKVKREMEVFGPQAVVSKYREYADEKEEDYLWWLDLPYVLCIELYTEQEGEQKIGLYSLEMAADLELDPKQYHVIAFEDAGDCKNMCYIIQAHMVMLGNGNAFVVARPPKDAFREAKSNGFGVSVIRKGEVQLNVDQSLEEVEELIAEIGSKIYHDKIMRERSVDINGLMKGVFGVRKRVRRKRSRRKLKKPTSSL